MNINWEDEGEVLKYYISISDSIENAVNLFKVYEFVKILSENVALVIIPQNSNVEIGDIEFVEYVARNLAHLHNIHTIKLQWEHYEMGEDINIYMMWLFKFFYYQEAKGDIKDDEVIEIFTSKYVPYKFNLSEIGVSRIISVEF